MDMDFLDRKLSPEDKATTNLSGSIRLELTFSSGDKADPQKTHSFALLGEDAQKLGC